MKRFSAVILAMTLAAVSFLTGCEEKLNTSETGPAAEYLELIQAYEDGKVISTIANSSGVCSIVFSDGSRLAVPETVIRIDDCTDKSPSEVSISSGWWSVNGVVMALKVETSLSREEAAPVYAYFDKATLHLYLSNRDVLHFQSLYLQEQERLEAEKAKKQSIPVVRIVTDGGAGIYDKKNYVKGSITIEDPVEMYSNVKEFTARMGIRGRGNSTWGWPKKPWKVKLDEKASLLGMPADKEWALLANYADRTLIRNITAMKLSEICGFSWTPRMRSVEVYLNGEYQGVYTLCEHKKVSKDRVDIDIVTEADNSGEALTGGYYLEIEQQLDETTVWTTGMGVPMMFSDPEEPTAEQLAYVKGLFADFEAALKGKDFADPQKGYAAYIDVPSFINFYIVQELTKNVDGNIRKSSFLTKERGKKLEMYHLWDFDLTLGNCGYFPWEVGQDHTGFWIKDYDSSSHYGGGWFWLLFKDPAFVKAVRDRWNELMPQLEAIPDFIDEQVFSLEKARKRNFERWDINVSVDWVMFPSLGTYEKEVKYLKDFYTDRLEWLDRELNKL